MAWRGAVLLGTILSLCTVARAAAPFSKSDLYRMGRQSSREGDFRRAAAAFEDMLRAESGHHSIQLAVVCERDTIARLVDAGESEDGFYFLPATVQGRDCYKALWGVYGNADTAKAALPSVPAGMRDGKNPPVVVAVEALLGVTAAAREVPPPAPASRAASAAAPASTGRKVFTDSDLTGYRKQREDEERRYGVPKPLFQETDMRKATGAKSARPVPGERPKTTVATAPDPAAGEQGYWTTLVKNAKATVDAKRQALAAAEKSGGNVAAARQELTRAEQALDDLRARAKEKGADPAWLR